jgi:hypothetical protein
MRTGIETRERNEKHFNFVLNLWKKKQFLIEPKSLQTHSQLLKASIAALREELWSEDDSDLRLFVAFHPPQ